MTTTTTTARRSVSRYGKATLSFAEATAAANYTVSKEPIYDSDGKELPRQFRGMFNAESRKVLGVVGDGFSFYQPAESLEIMRAAVETVDGAKWQSVAVTGGGAGLTAFAALPFEITAPKRGDKVGLSFFMRDAFDGSARLQFGISADTLVCTNGAIRSASLFGIAKKHTPNLKDRIESVRVNFAMRLQDAVSEVQGFVHKLDSTPMSRAEVDDFSLRLFGVESETALAEASAQTRSKVEAVRVGFVRGTGNVGRTRWDAFNAVTEFADWQGSFRTTETTSAEENRFESLLSGNVVRLKDRAAELLLN